MSSYSHNPIALAQVSDGEVPESRITSPNLALQLADDLWTSDYAAQLDRAVIDNQCDGAAPMDQGDLRNQGDGNMVNVNFLGAQAREQLAMSAYYDMANTTEQLISCEVDYGNSPEERQKYAKIFSEEYTRLMRHEWDDFVPNLQFLAKFFIRHGVSIAFRDNDSDWRWNVSRLGDFQVYRRQGASMNDFQVAIHRVFYSPPQVYEWIKNRETAEAMGWNVDATMKALEQASRYMYGAQWDVAQWQRDMKDNSLWMSKGIAETVELHHLWVKEFNGKVSHYIVSRNNSEEFIYVKKNKFDSPKDAFVFFTYGNGNGDLYSVRGLGWLMFGAEQLSNIVKCKAANSAIRSFANYWQAKDATAQEDFEQITFGADDVLIPASFEYKANQSPNLTAQAIPFMQMLDRQLDQNTGTYQSGPIGSTSSKEMTAKEVEITAAQQATLTTASMAMFYQSLDCVHRMTVKALTKREYPSELPGGKERWRMLRRCMEKGMPEEAFYNVSCVKSVRVVGYGSAAQKAAASGALLQFAQMNLNDPVAQQRAKRMYAVANFGVEVADQLVPEVEAVPPGKKEAELESSLFLQGITPEVLPSDDDAVHLFTEHYPFLGAKLQEAGQGAPPEQIISQYKAALDHCGMHVKKMEATTGKDNNGPRGQALKQARIQFQQFDAQLTRMLQNFASTQSRQQAEAIKAQQDLSAEEIKAQMEQAKFVRDQQRKDAEAQAKIGRTTALTQAELAAKRAQANAAIETMLAKTQADVQSKARRTQQDLAVNDLMTAQELQNSDLTET